MYKMFHTHGLHSQCRAGLVPINGVIIDDREGQQYVMANQMVPGDTNCCGATKLDVKGSYNHHGVFSLLLLTKKAITIFTTNYGVTRATSMSRFHQTITYLQLLQECCNELNIAAKGQATWDVKKLDDEEAVVFMTTELLQDPFWKLCEELRSKLT